MYRLKRSGSMELDSMSATLSAESLVTLAQNGCHVAYAELCKRHRDLVFRTVQRITRNQDDTEDVLQDAWMKAFVHIKAFDGRSSFSTWLTRIAINSALMMLRKRKRHLHSSLDDQAESGLSRIPEPVERSHNPEERFMEMEIQFLVRQAIRRLPSVLRGVTEIRQADDRPIEEIALMAGLSVAATKSRLRRARLALRERLQPLEEHACSVDHS